MLARPTCFAWAEAHATWPALPGQRPVDAGQAGFSAEDRQAVVDAGADALAGDGDAERVDDVADLDALRRRRTASSASSSGPTSNGSAAASTARNFCSSSFDCGGATRLAKSFSS